MPVLLRLRRISASLAEWVVAGFPGLEPGAWLRWGGGADLGGVLGPASAGAARASLSGWRLRFGACLSPKAGRPRLSRPDMMENISRTNTGQYEAECDVAVDK